MSQPRPYADIYIKFAKRAPLRKKKKDLAEFIKEPNGDFLLWKKKNNNKKSIQPGVQRKIIPLIDMLILE